MPVYIHQKRPAQSNNNWKKKFKVDYLSKLIVKRLGLGLGWGWGWESQEMTV